MPELKTCGKCRYDKPLTQFHSRTTSNGKTVPRYHIGTCWTCRSLWARYKMTHREYDELLASQGGGCAICGSPNKLQVDHCHATGKVRGILCAGCNSTIGFIETRRTLLTKMVAYLRAHA